MRPTARSILFVILLALPASGSAAHAAPYQRRWFTVDGGGYVASADAANHRLAGSIGQPDAGVMTGGLWRLRGGFWSAAPGIGWVDVPDGGPPAAAAFSLHAPIPNPARGSAAIEFVLPEPRDVVVRVTDVQGRLVRELDRSNRPAGRHRLTWDGRDASGVRAATGLYFVHADAGRDHAVTRLVLFTEGGRR